MLKPRIASAIKYFNDHGISKIAGIGFCWGGWVLAEASLDFPIVCGVSPHPSFRLADATGGSSTDLITKVKTPFLLLPAGNDPDNLKEGGELAVILKANNPLSETTNDFEDQQHGFAIRGDTADEAVKVKVELAFKKIYAYVAKFF